MSWLVAVLLLLGTMMFSVWLHGQEHIMKIPRFCIFDNLGRDLSPTDPRMVVWRLHQSASSFQPFQVAPLPRMQLEQFLEDLNAFGDWMYVHNHLRDNNSTETCLSQVEPNYHATVNNLRNQYHVNAINKPKRRDYTVGGMISAIAEGPAWTANQWVNVYIDRCDHVFPDRYRGPYSCSPKCI